MNSILVARNVRRKAVWGPKRFTVLFLLCSFGFVQTASAAGRHRVAAPTTKPGVPGKKADHPKLDHDSTARADRNPNGTTSVIVTLQPGAKSFVFFVWKNWCGNGSANAGGAYERAAIHFVKLV